MLRAARLRYSTGKLSIPQYIACPNCSVDEGTLTAREDGFNRLKCRFCGLLDVNPRPGDETIGEANKTGVDATDEGHLHVKAHCVASNVP
jgi:hypothetical protein